MNVTDEKELILKSINAALKSRKLYPPGHPSIATPVRKALQVMTDSLKTRNNLMIGVVNEALVFEDDLVPDGDKLYPELIQHMGEKNVNAVIFERGFSEKELSALTELLSSGTPLQGAELQKELHAKGITRITLKSIPMGRKNMLEVYNGAVEIVKTVMGEIRMGKIPKAEPVNRIVDEITDSVLSDPDAIIGLTMIKNYDNYLYNHSVNVSIISLALGRALGLAQNDLHAVGCAALLHDVGKTGVAENIIRKPGGLSSEEWDKIKEHPQLGFNIIKRMDGMEETIGRLIYEHHIKFDHSGYPHTTSNLHPFSQIISISDAYDALTTLRVYQKPHDPVEAVNVMANFSGRHFNPDTMKAFINMIGLYPVGTMLRLSTNEVGIVTKVNPEASDSPVIKVLYDKDGLSVETPFELDLAADKSRTVTATVNPAAVNTDVGAFFAKESAE